MARNQEKAQTMLARYLRRKLEEERGPKKVRPAIASDCKDLSEAENWRGEIVREITRMISDIQNIGLEEHEVRELNDKINQRIRLKHHWEKQIVELGGPDYSRAAAPIDGGAIVGERGYKYFGVAKDLPGVREFLEQRSAKHDDKRPTRGELLKRVDISYYGFLDDDEKELARQEAGAEVIMRDKAIKQWEDEHKFKGLSVEDPKNDQN